MLCFSSSSSSKDDEIYAILNQWKRNDDHRVRGKFIALHKSLISGGKQLRNLGEINSNRFKKSQS